MESRPSFLDGGGQMGDLINQFDWSSTSIGPLEFWPQSLKTAVSIILHSNHPMWIGWGREMIFLYNDAYVQVLGLSKHPWALGKKAQEVWKEIWGFCGPMANKVFDQGVASFFDETHLFMDRGEGFVEETFYSFSYSPIRDESGQVGGLFCPSSEITAKILNTRRLGTLSELTATSLVEKTIETACASAAQTLAKNQQDIPFALLYLVDSANRKALLCQAVNIDKEIPSISPSVISWNEGETVWPVTEMLQGGAVRTVSVQNPALLPAGVAGYPVTEAIVVPVTAPGQLQLMAILIAGISPNRRLDTEYRTFSN